MLVVFVLVAFEGTLRNQWIEFDDPQYVTANRFVLGGLTWEGFAHFLHGIHGGNWHPLTSLSHMLDVQVFGLSPVGPHAVNLGLHATNAVLAFLVLSSLTRAPGASFVVALLFALHPLRVESVAWISERKDVLSTFFFWVTLALWQRWIERPSRARYALLVAVFVLGLLAKPMLVTLPFLLLLLDVWPLDRVGARLLDWSRWRALVREKLPLFALGLVFSAVTFFVQRAAGAMPGEQVIPFVTRLENAPLAVWRYLGKICWPSQLAIFYPLEHQDNWMLPVAAFTVIAVASIVVVRRIRTQPFLAIGWLWFLGMLVPVIGLVQVGSQGMADRYMYLPGVGIAIVAVFLLREGLESRPSLRPIALGLLGAIAVALILVTRAQVTVWRTTRVLFEHTLAVTGPRNPLAQQMYGAALLAGGEAALAKEHELAALQIAPNFAEAHSNLGTILALEGKSDEAINEFRLSLVSQDNAETRHNLGFALEQTGKTDEAIAEYEAALRLDPDQHGARSKLGMALLAKGRLQNAKPHLERALHQVPDEVELLRAMAIALTLEGDVEDAIKHYEHLIEVKPDDLDALNNVAWIRATHVEAAHRDAAKAVLYAERARDKSSEPNATIHSTLAAAYAEAGRFPEAVATGERAVELARRAGDQDAAARFAGQLEQYRAHRPGHP